MKKILIVEDDKGLREGIELALKREDFSFVLCESIAGARDALSVREGFDLILLDLNLPDGSGYELLKEIKNKGNEPVIILTANDLEMDEVRGLELGAEDYITKPFSKAVLVSKIRAIVRRTQQYIPAASSGAPLSTTAQVGAFTLHFDSQTVYKNDKEISLSSKEFSLLCFFMENPGVLLTKQEIFTKVWKSETLDDNSILVYIKRLRDKIEDNPSKPKHLTTVWGKGYCFHPS